MLKVSNITDAIKTLPQDAAVVGVFVQRVGVMDANRVQEYKVRIVSELNGAKNTVQFNYKATVNEKKDSPDRGAPLKQNPFAGLKNFITNN
jgi:hypothetical protein